MVLVSNVLQVQSYRQTSPMGTIIKELLKEEQYSGSVNQSFILQFSNYSDIFDISLSFLNQETFVQVNKNDPLTSHLNFGCQPYNREIQYKQLFHLVPLFENETIQHQQGKIISLYLSTDNIFILRSDLKLFIMKLKYDLKIQEIVDCQSVFHIDLNNILTNKSEIQWDPVLKCYQNNFLITSCYVLTQQGTIHFQYDQEENKMVVVQQVTVQLSSNIKDVYLDDQNKLLLVLSQKEVQVYQLLLNGSLSLIQNLFSNKEVNLMQVKTNKNGTHIFILDQQQGIFIYEIDKQKSEIKLSDQNIDIKGARAFDFFGDVMFILLETEDELQYVLELFYDLEKGEHYFNRITFFEQKVHDLHVNEKLTFLIGNNLHTIIENSLYHKFYKQDNQNRQWLFFNENDLIQVDSLKLPWSKEAKFGYPFESGLFKSIKLFYDETYIVSISEKEVNLFVLNSISPWIQCMAQNTKKEFYQLRIQSQKCPSMKQLNNNSAFVICESEINFTFQGLDTYFNENNQIQILIIVGILLPIIIVLLILLMYQKNRFQQESQKIEQVSTQKDDSSYLKTESQMADSGQKLVLKFERKEFNQQEINQQDDSVDKTQDNPTIQQ